MDRIVRQSTWFRIDYHHFRRGEVPEFPAMIGCPCPAGNEEGHIALPGKSPYLDNIEVVNNPQEGNIVLAAVRMTGDLQIESYLRSLVQRPWLVREEDLHIGAGGSLERPAGIRCMILDELPSAGVCHTGKQDRSTLVVENPVFIHQDVEPDPPCLLDPRSGARIVLVVPRYEERSVP